jgi:cytochrome c553
VALLATLPALSAHAQDQARGRELFQLCSQCHGPDGGGSPVTLAPSIAGLPEWYVERQLSHFRDGIRGTHFDDIAGMRMRPMARWIPSDADVKIVAAYVASLPPVKPAPMLQGGDPARGQTLFAPCTACHGADAKGNQALNAPPLNHASDWYLITQLKNFKAGIRGANPQDTTGALMRPMAQLLVDEQAMKDVIAYIMTLPQ